MILHSDSPAVVPGHLTRVPPLGTFAQSSQRAVNDDRTNMYAPLLRQTLRFLVADLPELISIGRHFGRWCFRRSSERGRLIHTTT